MTQTTVTGKQIKDDTVYREDLNTDLTGHALITKVIAGTGISITYTGVDAGTGDVTINATGTSGVTTIGTIDSQTKSANGLVISGVNLYAQSADASNPGLITISAQTIAGNKTFTGNIILTNNVALQIKDSGGTAQTILNYDGSNVVSLNNATSSAKIQIKVSSGGSTEFLLAGNRQWYIDSSGQLQIDASNPGGNLVLNTATRGIVIGNSTASSFGTNTATTIFRDPSSGTHIGLGNFGVHAQPASLKVIKDRSSSWAGGTASLANDEIFRIDTRGCDNNATYREAARIAFFADANALTSSVPGRIELYTTSSSGGNPVRRWYVDSSGILQQDSSNGGDIAFNKSGGALINFTTTALSGTGTTQSGATALAYGFDEITTITGGSAEAFVLPTAVAGKEVRVWNRHATATAKIFPASGAAIDGLGSNAVYSLGPNNCVSFNAKSSTQWYTFGLEASVGGMVSGIGTIDTQTKSSDGLVISGVNLYAQTADATHPGMVSTVAQTFTGGKTVVGVATGTQDLFIGKSFADNAGDAPCHTLTTGGGTVLARFGGQNSNTPTAFVTSAVGLGLIAGNAAVPSTSSSSQIYITSSNIAFQTNVSANGTFTFANAVNLQWKTSGGTATNILSLDGSNNVFLNAPTGQEIDFKIATNRVWYIDSSGNKIQDGTNGGALIFNKSSGIIRQGTASSADNNYISLNGGGADSDNTRGAFVLAYGNNNGNTGSLLLQTGNASGAALRLYANASAGQIFFYTGGGTLRWRINDAGQIFQDSSNGGDVVFNISNGIIRQGTSSSSDTNTIYIYPSGQGGGGNTSRAPYIYLAGNQGTDTGQLQLWAGNVSGSKAILGTVGSQNVELWTNNARRWFVDSSGNFVINSNSGANIGTASLHVNDIFAYNIGVGASDSTSLGFYTNGVTRWNINSSGNLLPSSNSSYNIGSATLHVNDIFAYNIGVGASDSTSLGFYTNGLNRWSVDTSGNLTQDGSHGADFVLNKSAGIIRQGTSSGSDNAVNQFTGGGAANDNTRGGFINLYGHNHATHPGQVDISTSNSASAAINLLAPGTSGSITFSINGTQKWQVSSGGSFTPISNNSVNFGTSSIHTQNMYTYAVGTGDSTALNLITNNTTRWTLDTAGKVITRAGLASSMQGRGMSIINHNTTETGNTAATETTLFTFSVPANTLGTDGDSLRFMVAGTFATSVSTNKDIKVKFGSTTILDTGSLAITSAANWIIEGRIIRTGGTGQKCIVRISTSSSVLVGTVSYTLSSETLSGALSLAVTGNGTNANDVLGEMYQLEWLGSST